MEYKHVKHIYMATIDTRLRLQVDPLDIWLVDRPVDTSVFNHGCTLVSIPESKQYPHHISHSAINDITLEGSGGSFWHRNGKL